jgi:translation initiation factor 2B subunit (eIF-2B alpha/beta/delta family)
MRILGWIIAIVIAGLAIVMLVAFIGRAPSLSRAEENYCADLAAYGQAVASLRSIDQNSTVEELQDALKAVQASWEDLRQSSQSLRQAKLDVVESSFNDLGNTITGVSDKATLAEARVEIYRSALEGVAQVLEAQKTICTYQIEPQR